MRNTNIQKAIYHLKHRFITTNNMVIMIAAVVAISWTWGAVGVMERNYKLQREIATKERELKLLELERDTLAYQQNYYQTNEYKELAARRQLGLVFPGEKALILPDNSHAAKEWDAKQLRQAEQQFRPVKPSNVEQWMTFLTGSNIRRLQQ